MESSRRETSKPDELNNSNTDPTISSTAIPLTAEEIESLRQDAKESSARLKELWAERLKQRKNNKPTNQQ